MVTMHKRKSRGWGDARDSVERAKRRRAFYTNSQHIAQGLLNQHFFSASEPDRCLLRYHNGRFLFFVPISISRASLRRFVAEHIDRLNAHPSAQSDSEQVISATPAKIRSVLLALRNFVGVNL